MRSDFSDLFNIEYVHGSVDSGIPAKFAEIFGTFAFTVISIIGFGMVMSAFIKTAVAALYFVVPSFWDKVDEAHAVKKRNDRRSAEGKQGVGAAVMGLGMSALALLPNVKASIEDKDKNVSPMTFFTKAITMMCMQVTIGVLIYYGYTADIGKFFATAATSTIDIVLANTDPAKLVSMLPQDFVMYNFATDGSKNHADRLVNEIAQQVTTTYLSECPSIVKDNRQDLAYEIEDWVQANITSGDLFDYVDEHRYDYSWEVQVMRGANISANSIRTNYPNDKGGKTFAFIENMANVDVFKHAAGCLEDVSNCWIRVTVNFEKIAENVDIVGSKIDKFTVYVGEDKFLVKGDGNTYIIELPEDPNGFWYYDSATSVPVNVNGKSYVGYLEGHIITITTSDQLDKSTISLVEVQGLKYTNGTGRYAIKSLNKATGVYVDGTFVVSGWNAFKVGDDPAKVSPVSSTDTSTSNVGSTTE